MSDQSSGQAASPFGPLLVSAETGEKFHTGRLVTQWKIDGPQTGGRFSVIHHQLPPARWQRPCIVTTAKTSILMC